MRALNDYGGALLAAGEYDEALRVLREADALIDEVVQGATQDTLNRKRRLHAALQATGRYAEALRFGEDLALRSARSQLSQVHTATLLRLANALPLSRERRTPMLPHSPGAPRRSSAAAAC